MSLTVCHTYSCVLFCVKQTATMKTFDTFMSGQWRIHGLGSFVSYLLMMIKYFNHFSTTGRCSGPLRCDT